MGHFLLFFVIITVTSCFSWFEVLVYRDKAGEGDARSSRLTDIIRWDFLKQRLTYEITIKTFIITYC